MNPKIKKRIAKEILILACSAALGFILYLSTEFYYNSYKESHAKELYYSTPDNLRIEFSYMKYAEPTVDEIKADKEASALAEETNNKLRNIEEYGLGSIAVLFWLVYPIRIAFFVLKWAIRTVKK